MSTTTTSAPPVEFAPAAPPVRADESVSEPARARESRLRSCLKAVSWRIVGTIDTMLWAWLITGKWRLSLAIGSAEALSKVILFYWHERAWARFPVERLRRWTTAGMAAKGLPVRAPGA